MFVLVAGLAGQARSWPIVRDGWSGLTVATVVVISREKCREVIAMSKLADAVQGSCYASVGGTGDRATRRRNCLEILSCRVSKF